jgi:hypothetical protein
MRQCDLRLITRTGRRRHRPRHASIQTTADDYTGWGIDQLTGADGKASSLL